MHGTNCGSYDRGSVAIGHRPEADEAKNQYIEGVDVRSFDNMYRRHIVEDCKEDKEEYEEEELGVLKLWTE